MLSERGELDGLEGVFTHGREDAARCRVSEGRAADDHALRGVQCQPEDSLQMGGALRERRSEWARGPLSCPARASPTRRRGSRGSAVDGTACSPALGVAEDPSVVVAQATGAFVAGGQYGERPIREVWTVAVAPGSSSYTSIRRPVRRR